MKAVVCELNPIKYLMVRYLSRITPRFAYIFSLARLKDIEQPKLIDDDWVLIKSKMSGICGSDIQLLKGNESYCLEPYTSKQFVIGHENFGIISKLGKHVYDYKEGDRVVVQPFLSCLQRKVEKCDYCKDGEYSLCLNVNEGRLARGLHIGLNKDTSGGWAEYFIAHKASVFKIPDNISDKAAIMVDGLACSMHSVLRNPPGKNDHILIYGSGTIGLLILGSLRALGYKNKITLIYSRKFQRDIAEKLGSNHLISSRHDDLYKKVCELTDAKSYNSTLGLPSIEGGFGIVYDCVGSSDTINNSIRFLKPKGTLVLVATSSNIKIDIAPVWFRELIIRGSNEQSNEKVEDKTIPTYQLAIDLIAKKKIDIEQFVTHIYPLEKFKEGLKAAMTKGKYSSLKVALKIG